MENKKIRFHVKFQKSISEFGFYQNFLPQSTGKAISYLLLLTITIGFLWLARPLYDFNTSITNLVYTVQDSVPDFELRDGQLRIDEKMPIITGDDSQKVIIDTSDNANIDILKKYDSAIFIGKDKLIQKRNGFETRTMDFSQLKFFTFNKTDLVNLIPLLRWINVLIVFFGLLWFFVSKLFSALILGVIGLFLSAIKNMNLKFSDSYKLSVYALTVPILMKVLLGMIGLQIPHFWILYYGVGAFYLWNVISMPRTEQQEKQKIE